MRTKSSIIASGAAGIAIAAMLALPAAATQQSTGSGTPTTVPTSTTAAPTTTPTAPSDPGELELLANFPSYTVHPGEAFELIGPCGSVPVPVKGGVKLVGSVPVDGGLHQDENKCRPEDDEYPYWVGTIAKGATDGTYSVYFVGNNSVKYGTKFGARITVVGGTQPTRPTSPAKPTQQVPVKPKGAPQTGGGGMADVVSSWG